MSFIQQIKSIFSKSNKPIVKVSAQINNPGPIFDNLDIAAKHVLTQINPISISQDVEYAWGFYTNDKGKIGYTDPKATGIAGSDDVTLSFLPGQHSIGMGHTHANYSTSDGKPTSKSKDVFNSDTFSIGNYSDMDFMKHKAPAHWIAFYLGTPSGIFLKWTSKNGIEILK